MDERLEVGQGAHDGDVLQRVVAGAVIGVGHAAVGAGHLDVQLGVFLRNLKALGYTYKGTDFTFDIDDTVTNKAIAMTYDNINLLDALFLIAG